MTDEQEVTTVVYPRFLGVDDHGDMVWELADGRWTWADDPLMATQRRRTFEPSRYLEKYGPVKVPEMFSAVVVPAPAEAKPARIDTGGPLGAPGRRGAHRALAKMMEVLEGWIEGAQSNHEACDHRGENTGSECWRQYAPSDIRNMINDAAREIGLAEFSAPTHPQEDAR